MAVETYFVGDDVLFKGTHTDINGAELVPTSTVVNVFKDDGTQVITNDPGTKVGNQVRYQYNTLPVGNFILTFKTLIGTDDRKKAIRYRVIPEDGVSS